MSKWICSFFLTRSLGVLSLLQKLPDLQIIKSAINKPLTFNSYFILSLSFSPPPPVPNFQWLKYHGHSITLIDNTLAEMIEHILIDLKALKTLLKVQLLDLNGKTIRERLGKVKKTKFPVSSYYHIYGWGVILG